MVKTINNALTDLNTQVKRHVVGAAKDILATVDPVEARCEEYALRLVVSTLGGLMKQDSTKPLHDRVLKARDDLHAKNSLLKAPFGEPNPSGLGKFNAFEKAEDTTFTKIEEFTKENADLISQVKKLKETSPTEYKETIDSLPMIDRVTLTALLKVSN